MVTLRAGLFLVGVALLAALAFYQPGRGAPETPRVPPATPAPKPAGGEGPAGMESLPLPVDRTAQRKVEAAAEYLSAQSWADACRLLQTVLDDPADTFMPVHRPGQPGPRWVSARAESERLLASLPPRALDFYQVQSGPTAKARLEEARRTRDPRLLDEVARRYLYTAAGAEALEVLATYHLDRGRHATAAACFARLLGRRPVGQMPEAVLLRAALAFRLAGEPALSDRAWKELEARAGAGGLHLGQRTVRLADLRREIERRAERPPPGDDWRLFRGDGRRRASAEGDLPYPEPRWRRETVEGNETRRLLAGAVGLQQEDRQPVLPGAFPVVAAGKLVYRSYGGICALELKTGKEWWRCRMPLSLDACMADPGKKVSVRSWLVAYFPGVQVVSQGGMLAFVPTASAGLPRSERPVPSLVYDNTALGTLSSDSSRVYAVEDLAVPPHPSLLQEAQPGVRRPLGPLGAALHYNRLVAVDLETGKVVWQLGGREKGEWQDCYFLGPPLPLSGSVYALVEKEGEIVLACLDAARGGTSWTQPLAFVRDKLATDVGRRLQAVHLASDGSVLVCPTNAGAVLGIDLLTHNLLWAYRYRARPDNPAEAEAVIPPESGPAWKASAPIIQDGKVVFTAADDGSVHCVSLRDGALLWKKQRTEDDLYLGAVARGKVLLVGKAACRAVSLADGSQVWSVGCGMPSGQGILSGGTYYLPLGKGAICALDLDRGQVIGSTDVHGSAPGNLLFHQGDLLSQSVTSVTAYRQFPARLAEIAARLAHNPDDPAGLAERGEMRLFRGDLRGAVGDLRRARAGALPADLRSRVRENLFQALTVLLDCDLPTGEPYLDEYRELCRVAVPDGATPEERRQAQQEERRRQLDLLCLLVRGREGRSKDPAADLRAYEELSGHDADGLLFPVPEDHAVRARLGVWAGTRVAALFAQADTASVRALRQEVARRWQELRGSEDTAALERFAGLFGSCTAEGREARLLLAERRMEDREHGCLLAAELNLLQLLDETAEPPFRARVLEALARLCARGGLPEDALFYYRKLARECPRIVQDGKTGTDLLDELTLDKRFLPYLDHTRPVWNARRNRVVEEAENLRLAPTVITLVPHGELTPYLRRHVLVLDLLTSRLKLLERHSGIECWSQKMALDNARSQLTHQMDFPVSSIACPVCGHLVVVNLGAVVFAVDLLDRRILWKWAPADRPFAPDRVVVSPQDDGPVGLLATHEVPVQLLGLGRLGRGEPRVLARLGPVSAGRVVVETPAGLSALDPLRGDPLWTRGDVAADAECFGDADNICVAKQGAGASRVLHGRDGVAMRDVPDFLRAYAARVGVRAGMLLVKDDGSSTVLRLYDVASGRTVWKLDAPANSQFLGSPDPDLVGLLAPNGKLLVADLRARDVILRASLDARHLVNLQRAWLLGDSARIYVALDCASELGAETSRWPPFRGMRCLPVDGVVYALDRATGALCWYNRLGKQVLLVDQFDELPILLFAIRVNDLTAGSSRQFVRVLSIDKRTGKRLYQKELHNDGEPFYALRVTAPESLTVPGRAGKALRLDPSAPAIELIGPTRRIRHVQVAEADGTRK